MQDSDRKLGRTLTSHRAHHSLARHVPLFLLEHKILENKGIIQINGDSILGKRVQCVTNLYFHVQKCNRSDWICELKQGKGGCIRECGIVRVHP